MEPEEIDGVICTSNSHKAVGCSNKKEEDSCIPFLPEDIIINILGWVPAESLYDAMRYVCKLWYKIVHDPDFIQTHLLRSTAGLFIQVRYSPCPAQFVEFENKGITLREVNLPFTSPALVCCNGLLLFKEWILTNCQIIFHIVNPITKKKVTLPPFFEPRGDSCFPGLAYIPHTRKYKVLILSPGLIKAYSSCAIFTVGVDNGWRWISFAHISNIVNAEFIVPPMSFEIEGFAYFANSSCQYHLLVVDVGTEIIHQISIPSTCKGRGYLCLKMGNFLSLVLQDAQLQWMIWVLVDFKTGEWSKPFKIDLECQKRALEGIGGMDRPLVLKPIAWLKKGEVLLFRLHQHTIHIIYNVKTGEMARCSTDFNSIKMRHSHVNSLVSLKS